MEVTPASARSSTMGRGLAAAAGTLLIAALLALPYCNVLFDCGCTWFWSGGSAGCNAFNPKAKLHCPWCEHPLLGRGLMGVAALAGAVVALRGDARSGGRAPAASPAARGGPAAGREAGLPRGAGRTGARGPRPAGRDLVVRTLAGTGVFLALSFVAGWVTAIVTRYPKFLGF
jgi:hypothetical protein